MSGYKVTGGCLCGGVKFELTKTPSPVMRCHCSMCRKAIGADFGTFGAVPFTHFKMLKEETLRQYRSSEHNIRHFCGVCGASVFDKQVSEEFKYLFVTLGSLDGDPGITVDYHIFAKDKAPWIKIDDGLPKCDGFELIDMSVFTK